MIKLYENDPYCIENDVLFPIPKLGNYNSYLKELQDLCGIQKVLKTHLARHTFAHLMLNFGIPLEVVSKMLGHKSITMTQRYCKVSLRLMADKVYPVITQLFIKSGELRSFREVIAKFSPLAAA